MIARVRRAATRGSWEAFSSEILTAYLRQKNFNVLLAEYGYVGVGVAKACRESNTPLIVHFHGYDASFSGFMETDYYDEARATAAAAIAVSRAMEKSLVSHGWRHVVCNCYGPDPAFLKSTSNVSNSNRLLAVGRFVDKKCPVNTILAFSHALPGCASGTTLRMIGDGPIKEACEHLVHSLGIENSVVFLGTLGAEAIREEMELARAFVQHSVVAANGDSEGTPVAILEAQAVGLPVVATRHAGIPDVVLDGETGIIVEEGDIEGMTRGIVRLAGDPESAAAMGAAAKERIRTVFSMDRSMAGLNQVLNDVVEERMQR